MGRAKRTPRAIASPNSPSTSTHTRETPFSHGETPFYYGETPLMLKKAFVALCFLLDGGIPRYGGVKSVSPTANWAQKRVICRVPSVSTAFARAFHAAKSKAQASAGAFPCGNGAVSFSVFPFSSCRPCFLGFSLDEIYYSIWRYFRIR